MNETRQHLCDKSMLAENLDEATSVSKDIDEETWKKIINEDNMLLKNNHKMTKPGYEDVSLLSLYIFKKAFVVFLITACLFHCVLCLILDINSL